MLIGITGKAGSGKDTVADYICDNYGWVKYSLASPIKRGICAIFGWDDSMFQNRELKESVTEHGKSPRQMAQTLGTEWGRELINERIWLMLAEKFIRESRKAVVIPDVRFENEAHMIRREGGIIIHLDRDVESVAAHSSEAGVDQEIEDLVIVNNGSIKKLHQDIDSLYSIYF